MAWTFKFSEQAFKNLNKLDKYIQKIIFKYIYNRLNDKEDPRTFSEPLSYDRHGLWRYRIGDYRVVCRIVDEEIVIVAINVAHRKEVYNW